MTWCVGDNPAFFLHGPQLQQRSHRGPHDLRYSGIANTHSPRPNRYLPRVCFSNTSRKTAPVSKFRFGIRPRRTPRASPPSFDDTSDTSCLSRIVHATSHGIHRSSGDSRRRRRRIFFAIVVESVLYFLLSSVRRLRRSLSSSRLETRVVADFLVSKHFSFSVENRNFVNERSFRSAFSSAKARRLWTIWNKKRRRRQRWRKRGRRRRHARVRRDKKQTAWWLVPFSASMMMMPSMTIGRLKERRSSPILSRMRCMFFAILRSRMRSNSESPFQISSSSSFSSLAVAAWCCCPGWSEGRTAASYQSCWLLLVFFMFWAKRCFCVGPEKRRFFLCFFGL